MAGRPSVYLQELQSLAMKAGIGDCQDLIRHKFLTALPHTIGPAIAAQNSMTLTQLGSLADELMPMHNSFCNLAQAQTKTSTPEPRQDQRTYTRSSSSSSSSLPVGFRPFAPDQKPNICRAHIYFAEKARFCKPWCKFPNKSNCKIDPSSRSSSPVRPAENSTGGSH